MEVSSFNRHSWWVWSIIIWFGHKIRGLVAIFRHAMILFLIWRSRKRGKFTVGPPKDSIVGVSLRKQQMRKLWVSWRSVGFLLWTKIRAQKSLKIRRNSAPALSARLRHAHELTHGHLRDVSCSLNEPYMGLKYIKMPYFVATKSWQS